MQSNMNQPPQDQPAQILDGKVFNILCNELVYGWYRDGKYLYIGATSNGIFRLYNHSIINRIEPFLETDALHVWKCPNIWLLEVTLNQLHKPKYSSIYRLGDPKHWDGKCLRCGCDLDQTRPWQKYCSVRCRTGAQIKRAMGKQKAKKALSIRPLKLDISEFI